MGRDQITHRDDGSRNMPGADSSWEDWVSATRTRNFCHEDPCVDWLAAYGADKGFTADNQLRDYDPRTDLVQFLFQKGVEFERVVEGYLGERFQLVRVAADRNAARDHAAVVHTWKAMESGAELITQAPIWNPENQTYGILDLLVRSDILAALFPGLLSPDEVGVGAPDISGASWHYRVVDIKYSTLHLLKGGHAAGEHLDYMAQVWVYNEALGRLQGLMPESGYLLGRAWKASGERGFSALDRLERVDRTHVNKKMGPLADVVRDACEWIRRVRREGAAWDVLPVPSTDEIRPNMGNEKDYPWHVAKTEIAAQLEDLTLLPHVTSIGRAEGISSGVSRWTDPACTAERCGISGPKLTQRVNAIIAANQSPEEGPVVFPAKVAANEEVWRERAPVEFFVDFETVTHVDDDLAGFPDRGGQTLIFMIGCGHISDGGWTFEAFTVRRLNEEEEHRIITRWLEYMLEVCREHSCEFDVARFYHWAFAEVSFLEKAYNSAAARHGVDAWRGLPWVDLLAKIVHAEPVAVRGAFNFSLKSIAKAMHKHGLISTLWGDGPTDGLGAMVGAWWCDKKVSDSGADMTSLELMDEIGRYNEVDCRVMSEILQFLRDNR